MYLFYASDHFEIDLRSLVAERFDFTLSIGDVRPQVDVLLFFVSHMILQLSIGVFQVVNCFYLFKLFVSRYVWKM